MRTKRFKTLKGFQQFVGCNWHNSIPVSKVLNGEFYIYPNRYHIYLDGNALEQFATMVAEYLYSDKEKQEKIRKAIMEHQSDKGEYLQSFYLSLHNGEFYINNSLSGEAFNYCRRKFLQQIY